jgi:hypothetical protein
MHAAREPTMVVRADNGVLRTEPIEVDSPDGVDSAVVPMSAEVSEGWNSWFENALEHHLIEGAPGLAVMHAVNLAIDERVAPLERQAKQIDELRLQIAQLSGAIDILRGRGAPHALRFIARHQRRAMGAHAPC